jgi:hypothetical protein
MRFEDALKAERGIEMGIRDPKEASFYPWEEGGTRLAAKKRWRAGPSKTFGRWLIFSSLRMWPFPPIWQAKPWMQKAASHQSTIAVETSRQEHSKSSLILSAPHQFEANHGASAILQDFAQSSSAFGR